MTRKSRCGDGQIGWGELDELSVTPTSCFVGALETRIRQFVRVVGSFASCFFLLLSFHAENAPTNHVVGALFLHADKEAPTKCQKGPMTGERQAAGRGDSLQMPKDRHCQGRDSGSKAFCRCPELGMAGEEAGYGKGDGLQMPRARPCQGSTGVTPVASRE